MSAIIKSSLCIFLSVTLMSCGTILHPERKGQKDGNLDTNIVVLNAIGLLFFIVPGVIAFAVDFSNGAIYLPDGSSSLLSEDELNEMKGGTTSADVRVSALGRHFDDDLQTKLTNFEGIVSVKELETTAELSELFRLYDQPAVASL